MKLELELEQIKSIQNLMVSRINDLRERLMDESDKEEELKSIIREYKKIISTIDEQLES